MTKWDQDAVRRVQSKADTDPESATAKSGLKQIAQRALARRRNGKDGGRPAAEEGSNADFERELPRKQPS
ncbi:hypothetical protein [Actinoallomurus sp. NPDC052274]|uniref:hypothetical protein n=1 Tax=Actinoallomurus sp. NPDC052274 TaxID=3155420 RepID=UPI00342D0BE4